MSLKKSVNIENAHATYVNDRAGWTWKVLKVYQKPELEKKNQYARWFIAAKSPNTFGSYEYGDTYINDILQYARLESATDEFKAHIAARA